VKAPKSRSVLFVLAIVSGACEPFTAAEAQQTTELLPSKGAYAPLISSKDDLREVNLSPGQLTIAGDEIRCAAGNVGYWRTTRSFKDYTLRIDFRFVAEGNSGYLVHIAGEDKVWPPSIEVQGLFSNVGEIFAIAGVASLEASDLPDARASARRPLAEWNTLEIVSKKGALASFLNGVRVATSAAGELREGPIGFQCEGVEIHWRNLAISVEGFAH
jgi:hypothetical protein